VKELQIENQIEKEHLLNFVVNTLDEELPIDIADGVRTSAKCPVDSMETLLP